MNPKAARADKDTSSLTPWESIDPDEPAAVGVLCAPVNDEDDPLVTVYEIETARERVAPSVGEEVGSAIVVSDAPVERRELEYLSGDHVVSEADHAGDNARGDLIDGAAREREAFDPHRSLEFDAPPQSLTGETGPVITISTMQDSSLLEEPTTEIREAVFVSEPQAARAEPAPVKAGPEPLVDAGPSTPSASPELFVDSPDKLDTFSEPLAPISDITQVVGEIPAASSVIDVKPFDPVYEIENVGGSFFKPPVDLEPLVAPSAMKDRFAAAIDRLLVDRGSEVEEFDDEQPAEIEDERETQPEQTWEDPEMPEEPVPMATGASWTIPLLCVGIGLIACCVIIPQADSNRRLAYEKQVLQNDLESVEKQVAVNDEFLKRVVDDPSLSERLAQRQLKRVRKGQRVLQLKDEKQEMSPFQIVNVAPPQPLPPYKPAGGVIASLCYDAKTRLYTMGAAMLMIACGLVLGGSPIRSSINPEAR